MDQTDLKPRTSFCVNRARTNLQLHQQRERLEYNRFSRKNWVERQRTRFVGSCLTHKIHSIFFFFQIALLKILLAAAPTAKAKTESINILADVLPEDMP